MEQFASRRAKSSISEQFRRALLALLGVMTLGAIIHVLGTVRARWPQWPGVEQANNRAG